MYISIRCVLQKRASREDHTLYKYHHTTNISIIHTEGFYTSASYKEEKKASEKYTFDTF